MSVGFVFFFSKDLSLIDGGCGDRFVSDCMGHLPLIHDDSHTTKFPSDVNEEIFGPHSLSLPQPHEESPYGNIGYFVQKCR